MALAAKLLRNRFARQAGVVLITIWALWYLAAVLGQRRPNPPSTSSQSEGRPSTASPPPQLAKPKTFLDESVAGTTGGGKAGAGGKNRQNDDKKVGNGGVGQAPKNSKLGGGVKEEKAGAAAAGAGADVGVGGLKTGPIGSSPKQEQGPGGSVNSEKGGKQRVGGPSVVHGGGANVPIDANSLRKGLGLDRILPLPEPQKGASLVPVESIKTNPSDRANAAIVILCRNKDLKDMKSTLRQFEDRFNRRYSYPYVFLNDEPFTEQFQEHIRRLTDAKVEFGVVEPHTWRYPDWINATMAEQCMDKMEKDGIIYGGSLSYRHMCRWYSGWFFRHPLVAKYEWYWRVEPGVSFFCDIPYDPFVFMQENKKSYGFVISLLEIRQTIPSLWGLTRHHAFAKGLGRNDTKLLRFFADEEGDYNGCHFWSNFEIAKVSLWNSPDYLDYFTFLDDWGGFYYERWGDAPVHSLYLGLKLRKDEVHFFNDIGYRHEVFAHCIDTVGDLQYTCQCPKGLENFDEQVGSCLKRWVEYEETNWTWGDPVL